MPYIIEESDGSISYANKPPVNGEFYEEVASLPSPVDTLKREGDSFLVDDIKVSEKLQEKVNREARAYLEATDWYVTRMYETGVPVPDDVLAKRGTARNDVSD